MRLVFATVDKYIYKSNYILSLFNYCLHTSPHATTISCGPVSFQEPLAFFPFPPPYACLSADCREGSRFVEKKERKKERERVVSVLTE